MIHRLIHLVGFVVIVFACVAKGLRRWVNYNGQITCTPDNFYYPPDKETLIEWVKTTSASYSDDEKPLYKVVGAGHSYSNVSQCVNYYNTSRDVYVINLKNLTNITYGENMTVTLGAGWTINNTVLELKNQGLTLPNLGTSRVQNYVGAFITGTHGTGKNIQNIASQVIGLSLLLANGTVIECSENMNERIFNMSKVSIGSLGIVIDVTIQAVELFKLKRFDFYVNSTELIEDIEYYYNNYTRIMAWGPLINTTKVAREIAEEDVIGINTYCNKSHGTIIEDTTRITIWEETNDTVTDNGIHQGCIQIAECSSSSSPTCDELIMNSTNNVYECVDYAYNALAAVDASSDDDWHIGIEHFAPLPNYKRMLESYAELQCLQGIWNDTNITTVMQIRFVKSDDVPLSEVYHTFNDTYYEHFGVLEISWNGVPFNDSELLFYYQELAQKYRDTYGEELGIRPHWGKPNWVDLEYAEVVYPLISRFIEVRDYLDPYCQFMNKYLVRAFDQCHSIFDMDDTDTETSSTMSGMSSSTGIMSTMTSTEGDSDDSVLSLSQSMMLTIICGLICIVLEGN